MLALVRGVWVMLHKHLPEKIETINLVDVTAAGDFVVFWQKNKQSVQ